MPVQDAAGFLAALSGFALIAAIGEIAHRRFGLSAELTRGVEHVTAGAFSATLPLFLSFREIALLAALLAGFVTASRRLHVFRGIHDVSRQTWGEAFFPLGLLLLALLIPRPPGFVYGALVMGVADGLAGLVGTRFGQRNQIGAPRRATGAGSVTFLLSCLGIGLSVLVWQGIGVLAAMMGAAAAALLLTPVEAALTWGLDDLILPTAAGTAMLLILHIAR